MRNTGKWILVLLFAIVMFLPELGICVHAAAQGTPQEDYGNGALPEEDEECISELIRSSGVQTENSVAMVTVDGKVIYVDKLNDAFEQKDANVEIVLLKDAPLEKTVIVNTSGMYTLDLNGKRIYDTEDFNAENHVSLEGSFFIIEKGELSVCDRGQGGCIMVQTMDTYSCIYMDINNQTHGRFEISSGTIKGFNYGINWNACGEVVVTGNAIIQGNTGIFLRRGKLILSGEAQIYAKYDGVYIGQVVQRQAEAEISGNPFVNGGESFLYTLNRSRD